MNNISIKIFWLLLLFKFILLLVVVFWYCLLLLCLVEGILNLIDTSDEDIKGFIIGKETILVQISKLMGEVWESIFFLGPDHY